MKIDEIKALAEIMSGNGVTSLKIDEGDLHIRMERSFPPVAPVVAAVPQPAAIPAPVPAQAPAAPAAAPAPAASSAQPVDFHNLKEVKSPMVGVFYSSPSPEAEPFVKVGSKVKKGDVLCIIEAMKLLNEINADTDGEIVDICVNNGDVVEYGQPLFKIF